MKIKKLICIFLILMLLPVGSFAAEEYPYLPTYLKEEVIELFGINTAGKTMLYEKVNIYGDLDAWMIGWFDEEHKIVTGITDTGDIIYYSISGFVQQPVTADAVAITPEAGETAAREFIGRVMPRTALELISSNAYEYHFAQTHNSIRILGREATVVVDKLTGEVVYYKGFGKTDAKFELMEKLITPEHAFESFYENIGLELVYNTVFDDSKRVKTIRPMYILNRSNLKGIDAQSGEARDIVMYDYNYYYDDGYYDEHYFYDNNIHTEEKMFVQDGSVSASGYDINSLLKMKELGLTDDYSAVVTPGRLYYYSNGDGSSNAVPVLKVDIVPLKYAVNVLTFSEKFDEGNTQWLDTTECETAFVFARAYVHAENGQLMDYETVKNRNYVSKLKPYFVPKKIDDFVKKVTEDVTLEHYGTLQTDKYLHNVIYARYADGIRVIGEGASVVYDSSLGAVTDYSIIVTDSPLMSVSLMQTPEQIKETVKTELELKLYYADKDENSKFVIYDAVNKRIAFDPFAGTRIDRLEGDSGSFIGLCRIGSDRYLLNGSEVVAPAPVVSSGKLCLPVELIAGVIGYLTENRGNAITLSGTKNTIILTENSTICSVNGEDIQLDVSPVNVSGNMYISAGSLRELFGIFVSWDAENGEINLIK